jgi:hypothetical protein
MAGGGGGVMDMNLGPISINYGNMISGSSNAVSPHRTTSKFPTTDEGS